MNKKILSFDVSSSTLANSVLFFDTASKKIEYVSCGYIKPIKSSNIIERLANTRDKIRSLIEKEKPDEIVIEDIIQFMAGASTAKTIITLTSFNRMIGLLAFDYLKRSPILINVMSIRHCIKRQSFLEELPKKEDLPLLLEPLLNMKFPWEFNKKGKERAENLDKSDALAVGYCYIINHELKLNIKKKKPKVK